MKLHSDLKFLLPLNDAIICLSLFVIIKKHKGRVQVRQKIGAYNGSQIEYNEKVFKGFNMEIGKALSTPLPPYVKLCLNDCPKTDVEKVEMAKVLYFL